MLNYIKVLALCRCFDGRDRSFLHYLTKVIRYYNIVFEQHKRCSSIKMTVHPRVVFSLRTLHASLIYYIFACKYTSFTWKANCDSQLYFKMLDKRVKDTCTKSLRVLTVYISKILRQIVSPQVDIDSERSVQLDL